MLNLREKQLVHDSRLPKSFVPNNSANINHPVDFEYDIVGSIINTYKLFGDNEIQLQVGTWGNIVPLTFDIYEINTLSACIKYVKLALVIILIHSILNIFGILKYSKPTEMACYALSGIALLYYIFKRHKLYNRDTIRVKVREIGSEVYKSGHETIDGEKDIKVIFNGNRRNRSCIA